MITADGVAQRRRTARVRDLRSSLGRVSWWVVGPLAVYVLLVLLGVTQSSIGISTLRVDPAADTPLMIGGGVGIRSDEYLTSTPILLGVAATGQTDGGNPLTAPDGFLTQLPSGPVSSVVLFDGSLLRLGPLVPDQMLVAAHWWLPFLLLALGAPAFFRALTGSRWPGLFAAAMIVASPASAWWSFSPLGVIGFTIAGAAGLQHVADHLAAGRRGKAAAWCGASAVLLARTPLHYQPWAIVLGVTILAVAIVPLVVDRRVRRTGIVAVAATGTASLLLAAGVVLENLPAIRATLGTVYPGARTATGTAGQFPELFAATSLSGLKHLSLVGTNPSEVSSAYTVAAVWAVLLLVAGTRVVDRRLRAALTTMVVLTGFWFTWAMVDFGAWASHVPVLSMVPPTRAADVLGYLATLLLCLVLPTIVRVSARRAALIGGVVGLVAAYAGSLLRETVIPDLSVSMIWLSSALLALVVVTVTLRPRWWGGYAASVVLGALLMWNVNPVQIGLADMRGTAVADRMLSEGAAARAEGAVWATDDPYVDALLTATGVPSLSSRQLSGPDRAGWEMLDPTDASENVWNRGGSFIVFVWTDSDTLTFTNPSPDVIEVSGSPCTVARDVPALSTIVSGHQLGASCLSDAGTFQWGGTTRWVYRVSR